MFNLTTEAATQTQKIVDISLCTDIQYNLLIQTDFMLVHYRNALGPSHEGEINFDQQGSSLSFTIFNITQFTTITAVDLWNPFDEKDGTELVGVSFQDMYMHSLWQRNYGDFYQLEFIASDLYSLVQTLILGQISDEHYVYSFLIPRNQDQNNEKSDDLNPSERVENLDEKFFADFTGNFYGVGVTLSLRVNSTIITGQSGILFDRTKNVAEFFDQPANIGFFYQKNWYNFTKETAFIYDLFEPELQIDLSQIIPTSNITAIQFFVSYMGLDFNYNLKERVHKPLKTGQSQKAKNQFNQTPIPVSVGLTVKGEMIRSIYDYIRVEYDSQALLIAYYN